MGNPKWRFKVDGETYTPETISALILKKLKQDAELHIGPIHKAVITVPAYFDDARRKATEDAGTDRRSEGPRHRQRADRQCARVWPLEGARTASSWSTTWAAARSTSRSSRRTASEFITLATDGDVELGGKDWDERLVNFLAEKFLKEFGADPRRGSAGPRIPLAISAEEAKKTLSRRDKTNVPVSYKGHWGNYPVMREEFESLTEDLLAVTQLTTEMVLEEAGITWKSVSKIIPTGGSTRMPAVMKLLDKVSGRKVKTEVPVDEAVAQARPFMRPSAT